MKRRFDELMEVADVTALEEAHEELCAHAQGRRGPPEFSAPQIVSSALDWDMLESKARRQARREEPAVPDSLAAAEIGRFGGRFTWATAGLLCLAIGGVAYLATRQPQIEPDGAAPASSRQARRGDSVPALSSALRNRSETPTVRVAAAAAVARLGPEAREAVPALVALLDGAERSDLRRAAAHALVQIAPHEEVTGRVLLGALDRHPEDARLRLQIAQSLPAVSLLHDQAAQAFLTLLRDNEPAVRTATMDALERASHSSEDVRAAVIEAAEHDPDRGVQRAAREALASLD
jgi:HEAT repeat protein